MFLAGSPIYLYTHKYICVYILIYICVCTYYIYAYAYRHTYYMCIYTRAYMFVCLCVHIYLCACVSWRTFFLGPKPPTWRSEPICPGLLQAAAHSANRVAQGCQDCRGQATLRQTMHVCIYIYIGAMFSECLASCNSLPLFTCALHGLGPSIQKLESLKTSKDCRLHSRPSDFQPQSFASNPPQVLDWKPMHRSFFTLR